MLKQKGFNSKNKSKYKKNDKNLRKEIQKKKKLSPKYTPKLKVNLSSSLKFVQKKNNLKEEKKNGINTKINLYQSIISKNLKKYNSNKEIKNVMIISNLIDCRASHFLAIFKDYLIIDYTEEFLRRLYLLNESIDRIPKLFNYYKNYLQFFCKPNFIDTFSNLIIKNYGDLHAEYFYKKHIEKKNKIKYKEDLINDNNIYYEEYKNNNNIEELVKTIFTKSIKNSIDNIKNDSNVKLNDDELKNKQESTIKFDTSYKISEGNTLLLMINEMKVNKNKQKNYQKKIDMKKNILKNKKYSIELYKTINNNLKKELNINNYNKKKINTYTNIKFVDSVKNLINSERKKYEQIKIRKNKFHKSERISSPKNLSTNKKNVNSIVVNINININTNQNRNSSKYCSSQKNSKKNRLPLSPLNLNILNSKDFSKKEPLTNRSNKDKKKTYKYIKFTQRKKDYDNLKILTTTTSRNNNKINIKQIKSLDSLEINEYVKKQNNSCHREVFSKKKKTKISNKLKKRNINNNYFINKGNSEIFMFNKTICSSTNLYKGKINTNSMKNFIKVNELKNKKYINPKNKNNRIYSP